MELLEVGKDIFETIGGEISAQGAIESIAD